MDFREAREPASVGVQPLRKRRDEAGEGRDENGTRADGMNDAGSLPVEAEADLLPGPVDLQPGPRSIAECVGGGDGRLDGKIGEPAGPGERFSQDRLLRPGSARRERRRSKGIRRSPGARGRRGQSGPATRRRSARRAKETFFFRWTIRASTTSRGAFLE